MNVILIAVISVGVMALVAALVLYVASKRFAVYEDPRIAQVAEVLPQANCGGCGYPGCSGLASAIVKAGSLEGKSCPVGGQPVMEKVAAVMGLTAEAKEPMVAVVRCNGTCANRPRINRYDGVKSCAIAAALYGGETGCSYGCLGCGDCTMACKFGAINVNPETGLPEVDDNKCTACGACVKACPKSIIELRKKGLKNRRVYVRCVNKDKGAVTRKACSVGCIGCGKCEKTCPFGAITVANNVAYIDFNKCKSCRKCVDVCPTHAIIDLNFPPKPVKPAVPATDTKPIAMPAAQAEKPVATASVAMPSVASIANLLPQANCAACGFDDCAAFAGAIVKEGGIGDKSCSVGGDEVMAKIAALLKAAPAEAPKASEATPSSTDKPAAAKVAVPTFELVNIAAHPKVDVVAKIAAQALAMAAKNPQKAETRLVDNSPLVPVKTTGLMAPQKIAAKSKEEAVAVVDKIASTLYKPSK